MGAQLRRLLPLGVAALLLASCSKDFPIDAIFKDGMLTFVGEKHGTTGFNPSYFSVRTEAGKAVWRIEATDAAPVDFKLFPLTYGVTPEGWKTIVPATRLTNGTVYLMSGHGGDGYHGSFRYQETSADNLTDEGRDYGDLSNRAEVQNAASE